MLLVIDAFEKIELLLTLTCRLVKNRVITYFFAIFAITQKSDINLYMGNLKIKKCINNYFKQMKIKIQTNHYKIHKNSEKSSKNNKCVKYLSCTLGR